MVQCPIKEWHQHKAVAPYAEALSQSVWGPVCQTGWQPVLKYLANPTSGHRWTKQPEVSRHIQWCHDIRDHVTVGDNIATEHLHVDLRYWNPLGMGVVTYIWQGIFFGVNPFVWCSNIYYKNKNKFWPLLFFYLWEYYNLGESGDINASSNFINLARYLFLVLIYFSDVY